MEENSTLIARSRREVTSPEGNNETRDYGAPPVLFLNDLDIQHLPQGFGGLDIFNCVTEVDLTENSLQNLPAGFGHGFPNLR